MNNTNSNFNFVYIEYKGKCYTFEKKDEDEDYTPQMFLDKCWFIVKNYENKELVDYYINKKYLGVTYSEVIENKLLSIC